MDAATFPHHESSLKLIHNDHRSCHITVAQAAERGHPVYKDEQWVSPEQKTKAVATDECWTLQWYADAVASYHTPSAADLDALLAAAKAGN
ncbi:hypothetical protein [Methylorubrum extorquens]